MFERLLILAMIAWLALAACSANAQPATPASPEPPAAPTTTGTVQTYSDFDVDATRQELREMLRRLPPEVGRVLKLDASLWSNQAYLSNYPPLAAFVGRHPEVARNPGFYISDLWIPLRDDGPPESAGVRMWRELMEGFFVIFGISAAIFVFTWIIRKVIEHRRWSRLSRVQAEVHNKVLDRFASNEDMLRYIQTAAGRKFMEAAPIPLDEEPRAVSAPISRVLWSVQIGVILGALGIGLKVVSFNVDKDVASALSALGILAIALGAGFILSAALSYLLSRKLGIWQPSASIAGTAEAHGE